MCACVCAVTYLWCGQKALTSGWCPQAFRPLLVGWIFDAIALALLSAMFPFFITYVIQPTTMSAGTTQALCFAALFIAAISSMPVWRLIANKIGRYQAWMGECAVCPTFACTEDCLCVRRQPSTSSTLSPTHSTFSSMRVIRR